MNTNRSKHVEQKDLAQRFNALTREKQEYVLSNLAGQLHKGEQHTQLYELIGKEWMELKFDLTSSHKSFAEDVEIAIRAAQSSVPPHWAQLVRNCMIFATLGSLATNVSPRLLGLITQAGQVNRALGYAALIENAEKQTSAYESVADVLLTQGQPHMAKVALRSAITAAERIGDPRHKVQALIRTANLLPQAGDKNLALEIVKRAELMARRHDFEESDDSTRREITQALANAGDVEGAFTYAKSIDDPNYLMLAAARIAVVQAAEGDLPGALKAIGLISSVQRKSAALATLVTELMRIGESAQSLTLMQLIPELEFRAQAFAWAAKLLAEKKQTEQAVSLAQQGLSMAQAISSGFQGTVIGDLAQALALSGAVDQALAAVQLIRDPESAAQALNEMVTELSRQGENVASVRVAREALAIAGTVEDGWSKAVEAGVFTALVWGGDLQEALQTARAIPDKNLQSLALSTIARASAERGEVAQVEQILEAVLEHLTSFRTAHPQMDYFERLIFENTLYHSALTFANKGQLGDSLQILETNLDRHQLFEACIRLGTSLVKSGSREAAAEVVDYALEKFSAIDPYQLGFEKVYEKNIVVALSRVGRLDWARSMIASMDESAKAGVLKKTSLALVQVGKLDDAWQIANLITDESQRAQCINVLAQCLAEAGHVQYTSRVVEAALPLVESLDDLNLQVAILSDLSKVLLKTGDQTQALLLIDRVLALLGEQGSAWDDRVARLGLSTTLARAGEDGFERAFQSAEKVKDPAKKTFALIELAAARLEGREIDAARQLALSAFDTAIRITAETDKASALARLAEIFAQCGEKSRLSQLSNLAETIEDSVSRANLFATIGGAFALAGEREKFKEAIERSLAIAPSIEPEARAHVLGYVALVLVRHGEKNSAREVARLAIQAVTLMDQHRIVHRTSALEEIVQPLLLAEDFNGAVEAADAVYGDPTRAQVLATVAPKLMQQGQHSILLQALGGITAADDKARILGAMAGSLSKLDDSSDRLQIMLEILEAARFAGRASVCSTINEGADVFASIDEGTSLREIYREVKAVDRWWPH